MVSINQEPAYGAREISMSDIRQSVRKVHLIFKTHLDVGFTDLARNVVAGYFDDYIPRAIHVREGAKRSVRSGSTW